MELWTEKYRPKKTDDIIGHAEIIEKAKEWLKNWKPGSKENLALLLWGPAGCGKTSIVHALCNEFDMACIEYNASEVRTAVNIQKIRANSTSSFSIESFFQSKPQKVLVLLDEVDGLSNGDSVSELIRWLQDPNRIVPICFTGNGVNAQLRKLCMSQLVVSPNPAYIMNFLSEIATKEGITVNQSEMKQMIKITNGDVRQCVVMLQFGMRQPTPQPLKPIESLLHSNALNSVDHIGTVYSVMLQMDTDSEILREWRFLKPFSESHSEFLSHELPKALWKDDQTLKQTNYSQLSQWNLWKRSLNSQPDED